ncbi:MAG: type II toxin-antitoxin system RelE/ParE family toxin [Thiotrichaceae bacterium]|nr:type II toxin-antitoxin system RelE/ParE family toxin [Thiotrichaceae bacterium]
MIKTFQHKGLEAFFRDGNPAYENTAGIQHKHADKLKRLLSRLNVSAHPEDMNLPGSNLHQLKRNLKGHYAVSVSGNWRLTFKFEGKDVILVDYQDYH